MGVPESNELPAPIPIKRQNSSQRSVFSLSYDKENTEEESYRSLTPQTHQRVQRRRPSYSTIESSRETHYNLDYPDNLDEIEKVQLDPKSRFFARSRPRTLNLPRLLPYKTELPTDRAKFLSHIVSHLYIAIKSLDIQGSLSITAKDLASLKDVSGLSDIDLVLETNLFETGSSKTSNNTDDDEASNYFSVEDMADSDSEFEGDEDDEIDAEGDEDDTSDSAVQHKKPPKSAAVVSVRIWTHELLVWLKMKYDMPLSLRISLAKVYYALCLCRGQLINLKIYVKTFEILTKDTELLRDHGLILPWEDLYNELNNHFPSIDSSLDAFEKKEHRQLLKLAERASSFYPAEALPAIFTKLGSKFSIFSALLVLSSMSMLPLTFVPEGPSSKYDIRHYIPSFFYIWNKLSKSSGIDSHLTSRIGTIAMSSLVELTKPNVQSYLHLGKSGVFSDDQMEYLIQVLINSLSIRPEKFGSMKAKFFHGFASAIVFSMNGDTCLEEGGAVCHLKNLLNAIESYVHPSNSGEWTRPISKLVLSLIYQFHKRFNLEREKNGLLNSLPPHYALTDKVVDTFVQIFLPLVKTGIHSKKESAADDYLSCANLLAYLRPEKVLEYLTPDIYESLEGVLSTHRVVIALRTIEELSRFYASTPVYRVHLTRILSLALPGIDSNDLEKTIHTLNTIASVANFVPFYDLTNGEGEAALALEFTQNHLQYLQTQLFENCDVSDEFGEVNFDINEEIEVSALKSSSSAFQLLMKTFAQKIFILLENIPDPSKSTGIEKDLCSSLPKFIFVILESLSDDIFKSFRKDFVEFITENTYYTISDVIAEIMGGMIKRDPAYLKTLAPILMDRVRDEITENGAGVSRTGVDIVPRDQPLFWNLTILNECVGNGGEYVVSLGKDLNEFSFYIMQHVKGPAVFSSSYLLNQILQATTKIRLSESRLIAPAYQAKYGVDEKCWGGFQFDEYRFSEESLTFGWFIPTEREVKFAAETFNDHVTKLLSNIQVIMKEYSSEGSKDTLHLTDELRMNLLYLSYALSGISFLLDPSFEEDIPKLSQNQSESIQQRLALLKQIRGMKTSKSSSDDELRHENLHENLQRIVEDIENNDLIEYMIDFDKLEDFNTSMIDEDEDMDKDSSKQHLKVDHSSYSKNRDILAFSKSGSPANSIDPSARATPSIEGVDMSSMNPGITFRERKLYTSRYFFGDDMETKRSNELYLKIHKTRHLIGKSLHLIGKFMNAHFKDDTKIFKHYLYALNIWFSDVGRDRILENSHAKISSFYVETIQHINRVRKPYTRILFGSRIEGYHLLRVALHSTSRTQTDLDKLLLEDVVKLSFSTYATIASAARITLVDAMKRLNGSYNVIARLSFRYLSKALEEDDFKKIESGLNIFALRRIKHKIQNDYFNLQKYVELLHRCLAIDNLEVNEIAQKLFKGVYSTITPPSSVCLIDSSAIDTIRPPDEFIDLEIKAVKLAKERKRKLYLEKLSKLEESVISNEKHNGHWKTTSLNLFLLIDMQLDYEIPINNDVFQILAKEASNDHPLVSRLALKGIHKLVNKLYVLQLYNYELKNMYDFSYVPKDFKIIKCSSESNLYLKLWQQEFKNLDHPDFFIDHKANNGWLFWDENMLAVTPKPCHELDLTPNDSHILKAFGNCVNKEWFINIVKLWIADNETTSAFQGTDVSVTASIVSLISNGYIENFTFEEFLRVIEEIYVSDDKGTHIVVCELLAGALIASKTVSHEIAIKRDAFIVKLLTKIFEADLSPDNAGVWSIFSWWVPSHIDWRRFPQVFNLVTGFTINSDSDSAIKDATRLGFAGSFISTVTWTYSDPEKILSMCLQNINNKYQAIRDQVGSLIAITSFTFFPESVSNGETFANSCYQDDGKILYENNKHNMLLQLLPGVFNNIEKWRLEVENLTPQEILKSDYIYAATTVLTFLRQSLNTSIAILYQDYVDTLIIPFLLGLINMKEVCQLGNIDPITPFKKVSQIPFNKASLERIVRMLEGNVSKTLNVVQLLIIGEFTETIYFKNLFSLDKSQRQRIIKLTDNLIYHKNVQVRESEASTLSGLIHTSPPAEVEELVKFFTKKYSSELDKLRKKYKKNGFKNISTEDSTVLHGATLGLGALVHAFPYMSPPPQWVPKVLTIIANKCTGIPGVVGKTAKDTLGRFKKTRQDTWHIDSRVFSEEQSQDLEGVLWKSYII